MPWQRQAMKDVASCDKLRGAAHRRYIRRSPNGETLLSNPQEWPAEYIGGHKRTQGSEPSQYLEEKKETSIPIVVASELGTAQTVEYFGICGVVGPSNSRVTNLVDSRILWKVDPKSVTGAWAKVYPDSKLGT